MNFRQLPLRVAIVAIAATFLHTASYGQSRQRWSFGPRVGANLSTVSNTPALNLPNSSFSKALYVPGLSAGVGALYSDFSRFGLGIDLLYSQRGYKTDYNTTLANQSFTTINRLHYLELPVTARYYLTRSGNFRPNVFAGPVFGARLSAIEKNTYNDVTAVKVDQTREYRPADLGVTAGFQLNFRAGDRQRFTIDGRYTYGLTNISLVRPDVHNQFFTLGVGYNFGIGRQYKPGDPKLIDRSRR